ncbi:MAG: hypothetical protein GC181_13200 [Bacteroidetes bacterium]|nr:hypothetical protein [Bacteroidota bacterium]
MDHQSDHNLLNSFKAFIGSHFMLNVINTIQSDLLLSRTSDAFQTLQGFNRLYKYALSSSNEQLTPVEKEVAFLNQYLDMEQKRFGNGRFPKSVTTKNLDPDLWLPSFVYQSLLENIVLLSLEVDAEMVKVHLECSENQVQFRADIQPVPDKKIHPKIEAKYNLALQRLEILKKEGLIEFEWNQNHFIHLNLTSTENL